MNVQCRLVYIVVLLLKRVKYNNTYKILQVGLLIYGSNAVQMPKSILQKILRLIKRNWLEAHEPATLKYAE